MAVVSDNPAVPPLTKKKKKKRITRAGHRVKVVFSKSAAKRRLTFECSNDFYKRVMHEKDERYLSLQQLAIRALERYLAVPEYVHRGLDEDAVGDGHALGDALRDFYVGFMKEKISKANDPNESGKAQGASQTSDRELEIWGLAREIGTCLKQLPVEKLRLLRESLFLDLKYYSSARIKSSPAERPAPPA
jgi:hypothetical protein